MRNTLSKNIWPKEYTRKAILYSISLIFILNVFFIKYYTPIPLLIFIILTIVFFFTLLYKYTVRWNNLSEKILYKKLFWHSVFYRLIILGVVFLLTWIYDPKSLPLEMFAADSWRYLDSGTQVTGNIFNGKFINILSNYWRDEADWGFSFYIGFINTIFFNSVLLIKIFNIFWGSLTVVYISKIATMLYSPRNGVIAGVITMLLPSLMWFNSMYLKETIMIFIIVVIFYNVIRLIKGGRLRYSSLILILLGILSLFYFRTVIAVIVALSLIFYFIVNFRNRKHNRVLIFFITLIFIGGIYTASTKLDKIEEVRAQYLQLGSGEANRIVWKVSMLQNLNVTSSLATPLVVTNALVSPYPSFLNIDERQITVISHAQNEITRIIMYFFALLGLYIVLKKDFRNSALILSFTLAYILILAVTGASYFDRFQLPAVPFMIIFMSVGILNSPRKLFNKFYIYLIFIFVATIAWHLFKFYIRN